MGCSESEQLACKKHQNHNQLQGVCPFCLTERLSHLLSCTTKQQSQTLSRVAPSFSSSLSSSYSSASSSSGGSAPAALAPRAHHHRNVSEVMGSIALMLSGGGGGGLKKSRSIIGLVPRSSNGGGVGGELKGGEKKRGFWSRLLRLENKKRTALMRSRTVRERL